MPDVDNESREVSIAELLADPILPEGGTYERPWAEHEARIVDDEGNDVAAGQVGELLMKPVGKKGVVTYFNNSSASDGLVVDGWVKTGDYFYRKDGDYFFVSRKRDILRRRGVNISPGAIEDEVVKHPSIDNVVALAVPSELGEDEIKIVVVPTEGHAIEPTEVAEFAERLPRHMRPRYIEVMTAIPVTPGTGRAQRSRLEREWRTEVIWDTELSRYLEPETATTDAAP